MLHSNESDINITFEAASDKSLTFEEILDMPKLAHFHDVVRYLQKKPNQKVFPKKYEKSMEHLASDRTYALFQENPKLPLNKVISSIMDKLPDDVPPQLLLKMTQLAIEEWENLTHKTTSELQYV